MGLSPAEQLAANSLRVPIRKSEFIRSRWLARYCMGTTETIARGPHGNPIWPTGWRGSISHKSGHVAVAVVPANANVSLGIDLERGDRVGAHLAAKICSKQEIELLKSVSDKLRDSQNASGDADGHGLLGAVFSLKEALFKAHFPIGEKFFYFHDAEISSLEFDLQSGSAQGKVKIATSEKTPAGSAFSCSFQFIELDGVRHVLSLVKTKI